MRAVGAALIACVLAACGNSAPDGAAGGAAATAERCPKMLVTRFPDKDFSSPRWQRPMMNFQLAGCDINGQVPGAPGNEPWWDQMDFWIYEAPGATSNAEPMLVIYLHGTSQTPVEAHLGIGWNELADRERIIVVSPHGRDSSNDNWEWGEASAFGRIGQLESVNQITTAVQSLYGIGPERTFIAGTSSGAISATMMAALYVDLYSGVMSVIGGSYNLSDPEGTQAYMAMGDKAKVMPAFLIHATADYLFPQNQSREADTQWAGTNDRADNGLADGSISQIAEIDDTHMNLDPQKAPAADECLSRQDNNPCPSYPLGYETYPYQIHRYRDEAGAGKTVVEAWYLQSMAHNYPYGNPEGNFTDPAGPDVTTAGYLFFRDILANR
ncbi:MAG TPA: PHB depolymerase family esterase [Verrucomicrobiae bacterium]|nr:PHB depolymerase family esterase [Verrucomicrobiae bacterium]